MEKKTGTERLSNPHKRKKSLASFNLFTGEYVEASNPLTRDFKTILELSCRAPYCPIPFALDTNIGVCGYMCIYCFTALTISSLTTSFFDSANISALAPRYANKTYATEYLDEVLTARGVEPYERSGSSSNCGSVSDDRALMKASSQRVPLRIGTRSENFLPSEKEKGIALECLKVIKDHEYPCIINSKSDLLIEGEYFKAISEMGNNVAIQTSIIHTSDDVAKKIEPFAPSPTSRWGVIKKFREVGINAMPRMEPCATFLNADDNHLENYFSKAEEVGAKNFMGDAYHHTVKAQEVRMLFYEAGFDFDRMWEATSEYQILGSYSMEKAMFYAKKHGLGAGTFNYHSLPWNDDPVCCMVGNQFGSWSKYSLVNALKNEIIEHGKIGFKEFDEKYHGYELHPGIRRRVKAVWNMKVENCFTPDFCEGVTPVSEDEDGNIVWEFNPKLIGQGYENIIKMYGVD